MMAKKFLPSKGEPFEVTEATLWQRIEHLFKVFFEYLLIPLITSISVEALARLYH